MKITIYRGTKEIGGTLIKIKASKTRILIDAGYPLFLKKKPIDERIAKFPAEKLLVLGVLPYIQGLYAWDTPIFDAVIVSHAHIDHYGLLKYIHPSIPVYMSDGTKKLIETTQLFKIIERYPLNAKRFTMYDPFVIGDFHIKPYLMDHSAFDAAAFEIGADGKTVIYTGDFRGHGRKAECFNRFIENATVQADVLLTEGTMLGRQDEKVLTEDELESEIVRNIKGLDAPVLFQSSSQNIDRLVTFYRAAKRCGKIFVIDVYTANVLYELRQLGNNLPYPNENYADIKVFYPYNLTKKIFDEIGEEYAKRFSEFHISRKQLEYIQNNIVMIMRPSMRKDLKSCGFKNGLFIYSLWPGYRSSEYQQRFEKRLEDVCFVQKALHTSGHAAVADIERMIKALDPKSVVPVHTMEPESIKAIAKNVVLVNDGDVFVV